ncbi:MAG: cysteine desulfurase [Acidimicrobiaceae bacterium]|nr:cysteine desulfurase [Acidimicrobiaceae bacterium]
MPRHYLDHASTSPARPAVVEAMLPWLTGDGAGDPGRVHTEGRMARAAIEDAREQVAVLLGARPREVVFTSGATEAANAAVWGAARRRPEGLMAYAEVEHSAVRDASARHRSTVVPVDRTGRIDPAALSNLDPADVALVHCQWGNHEVGTLQPVAQVVEWCRAHEVLVHIDAAQAAGRVPIDFDGLGADLMSVSAHKLGGPKGVGALLVRRGLRLDPMLVGGEQERARRAGLENVPGIVGFGAAARALSECLLQECERSLQQSERLLTRLEQMLGVHAFTPADRALRLPHIACFAVDGVEAEPVLLGLDQAGIAAHSGSACSSESLEPSPVLEAMGVDADHSLRFSVGWSTTEADVDAAIDALPRVVERLRALR